MRISWFTNNYGSFSSYYLYNDEYNLYGKNLKMFCRIRLELGRDRKSGDNGFPCILTYNNRAFGFSEDILSNDENKWAADDGSLMYYCDDGSVKRLIKEPKIGYFVYDMNADTFVIHNGNKVSDKPFLPYGINKDILNKLAMYSIERHTNFSRSDESLLRKNEKSRKSEFELYSSIMNKLFSYEEENIRKNENRNARSKSQGSKKAKNINQKNNIIIPSYEEYIREKNESKLIMKENVDFISDKLKEKIAIHDNKEGKKFIQNMVHEDDFADADAALFEENVKIKELEFFEKLVKKLRDNKCAFPK